MAFVSFLGCDGSGKSAVIASLTTNLGSSGKKVSRGHWRPFPFSSASTEGTPTVADDPHGKEPRGALSSVMKLGWLWLNWWLGWWKSLRKDSRDGFVLFDRFHGDLLVDPRRYRYGGPMWVARLACRLMPRPDLVLFLDADPEVLLSRKREVPREALVRSREAYLRLAESQPWIRVIDASRPLETVVAEVRREIALL